MIRQIQDISRAERARGAQIALVIALIFALFHFFGVTDVGYDARIATRSAFVWLWRRWMGDLNGTWLASSHWIPLVALLLVWSRRHELRAAAGPASRIGLAFVLLALALHWAGARAQQTRLSLAAFALLLWAIPYYAAGWKVARGLAFPCAFLLLAMPLNFLDGATRPLRYLAVKFSALLLGGLGLNVGSGGAQVFSRVEQGFRLDLADPASGIYFLTALLAVLLAVGFLRRWTLPRFLVSVALLPVVCVAANVTRTVVFALAGEAFGAAAASAGFGSWSGSVMFMAALGLLAGLARAQRRYLPGRWTARRAS